MSTLHSLALGMGTLGQHAARTARAERHGYLHQAMHEVSGLARRIVDTVPCDTGMYLIGEGKVVHRFDPEQLAGRNVRVVTVDRDLPDQKPAGVTAQLHCDLLEICAALRTSADALIARAASVPVLPGSFVASHIGRYLPDADTEILLKAGMNVLPTGGNIWIIDTPLAARLRKISGSPGFDEVYRLAKARDDVRIAIDEVIAPVVPKGMYYKLNDLRSQRPGSDDDAFFHAAEAGDVHFESRLPSETNESVFCEQRGKYIRVNGWGIRAMMLEKL